MNGNGNGNGSGSGRTAGVAGVNLLALRSHNGALVLDLLRTAGVAGISRLELAERTGLTPQAVSKITARLRADGLVTEAGYRASTGGKPRTVLRLVPDAGHAVGLHLDRDELTAVLCDLTGTVVAERQGPLNLGAGADAVVEGAAREVEALLAAASESRTAMPDDPTHESYGSPSSPYSASVSPSPAPSTICTASCTGSPGSRSGTGFRCGRRWHGGSGCRWWWTRTPTRRPWGSRRSRGRTAPSPTSTSVRGWGPGS